MVFRARGRARDTHAALAGSREWKRTLVDELDTDPIADPAEIGRNGAEVSDETFRAMRIVSSDARRLRDEHAGRRPARHHPPLRRERPPRAALVARARARSQCPTTWTNQRRSRSRSSSR